MNNNKISRSHPKHTLAKVFAVLALNLPYAALPSFAKEGQSNVSIRNLTQLGAYRTIHLHGIEPIATLNTGIRLDEAVSKATLRLNLAYSPALLFDLSHLKIYVNDELANTVKLSKENAGQRQTRDIELDPRLFTGFTSIRIEMVAHYTLECEDPFHSSLWTDIHPETSLILETKPVELVDDLALLPAPFFDKRDSAKLALPIVLPTNPSPTVLKAAGTVTSWLGAQAGYREARFTAHTQAPADQHAIIFGTQSKPPAGVDPSKIIGPMLSMEHDAANPTIKRLLVLGRTEEELLTASQALVLERAVLSGKTNLVKEVSLGPERKPYDAPAFIRTDRAVRLGELTNDPSQLEVTGNAPNPIRFNVKVPADLFSWAGRTVPLQLKYRYTPPSTWNDSTMNVEINDALVQSFRLRPQQGVQERSRLTLGLLSETETLSEDALRIPAFRLGGNNSLSFRFRMASQKTGPCNSTYIDATRAAIDPESLLDLSDLPHYTLMPNLAAFANGGFPFSNFADMSDTSFVLPTNASQTDLTAFLTVMGHMGKWTGLPAFRSEVLKTEDLDKAVPKHLFIIGQVKQTEWLNKYKQSLPMVLEEARRSLSSSEPVRWITRWWREDLAFSPSTVGKALIQTDGPIGALLGFQSPFSTSKSAVVLTGTDSNSMLNVLDALDNAGKVPQIRGGVTLVRSNEVEGFDLGRTYTMGSLPLWLRLRILFSEYPLLISLIGVLSGLIIAVLTYGWLSRRAQRRLQAKI